MLAEMEAFESPRHGRQLGDRVKISAVAAPASVTSPAALPSSFATLGMCRRDALASEDGIRPHRVKSLQIADGLPHVSLRRAVASPAIALVAGTRYGLERDVLLPAHVAAAVDNRSLGEPAVDLDTAPDDPTLTAG